jgi:hypothetical protein
MFVAQSLAKLVQFSKFPGKPPKPGGFLQICPFVFYLEQLRGGSQVTCAATSGLPLGGRGVRVQAGLYAGPRLCTA